MDCRALLLLTLGCFTVAASSVSVPVPSPSEDVLTSEGASFSFSCSLYGPLPDGWYLQVLKLEIVFPTFTDSNTKPGQDIFGDTFDFIISTETQLNPSLPRDMADRYNVSRHGRYGVIVDVTDAVASDSGQWSCRATSENSSSSTVNSVMDSGGSNITVFTPVLDMRLFEADHIGTRRYVTDNVTLNADEHKIFGCEVWINQGVPELTGYWDDGSDKDQIDASKWHIEGSDHREFSVAGWHVWANSSGLLWTRTQDIPDVGSRNGAVFSCEATLPVIGTRQTNITVFSSTPPEVDDGGNSASTLVSQLLVGTISALVATVYCS